MADNKLNLYEKIAAVADDVRNISKNMTVGSGSYSYKAVSDIDVTLKVKAAEKRHGVVSIPIKQELISNEVIRRSDNGKELLTYSFVIKMTTKIADLESPDSFIEIESFGHGLDSGDKGFGKASTYARKYALLNAYKIATGEDPDHDPSKNLKGDKQISDKRIAVYSVCSSNNDALTTLITRYSINKIEDLTDEQIAKQYDAWVKKGVIR